MKNIDKIIKKTVCLILFIVFFALIVMGHRNNGYDGIATMLLGLTGLLGLLLFYNQQNK